MSATVRQLAELVQGEVQGNAEQVIIAARPLNQAEAGDITFLDNERHAHQLHSCRAAAVVTPRSLPTNGLTAIRVDDPLTAFINIVRHLHSRPEESLQGIDPRATVHPTAQIGQDSSVHPLAIVGEGSVLGARCRLFSGVVVGRHCRIGDEVMLYPNVVLYDGTVLGHRVIIHANSVIGADGFGYRFQKGRHLKIPQLGNVEIGNDVEIGACTTIDCATFGATRIGEGTKIDNQVQIGHNCQIGRHNIFVSQVGIAGSSTTGDYVTLAGQVGVADHIHIGDRVLVGAQSGVYKDIPAGERCLGAPAVPEVEQKRLWVNLAKLPELRREVKQIKKKLGMENE